jgi:hypothetical protein
VRSSEVIVETGVFTTSAAEESLFPPAADFTAAGKDNQFNIHNELPLCSMK